MKVIKEFEVWYPPGEIVPQDYGKSIQINVWNEGIPKEVFLGVSNVPDNVDCQSLALSINGGELSIDDFRAFCESNGYVFDINNNLSACKFIEFSKGACIAWLHLPEDQVDEYLEKIKKILEKINNKLLIADA